MTELTCSECGVTFTPRGTTRREVSVCNASRCRSRAWRKENPEESAAKNRRNNRAKEKRKVQAKHQFWANSTRAAAVRQFLARGKDPVNIAISMGIPVSFVLKVKESQPQ